MEFGETRDGTKRFGPKCNFPVMPIDDNVKDAEQMDIGIPLSVIEASEFANCQLEELQPIFRFNFSVTCADEDFIEWEQNYIGFIEGGGNFDEFEL